MSVLSLKRDVCVSRVENISIHRGHTDALISKMGYGGRYCYQFTLFAFTMSMITRGMGDRCCMTACAVLQSYPTCPMVLDRLKYYTPEGVEAKSELMDNECCITVCAYVLHVSRCNEVEQKVKDVFALKTPINTANSQSSSQPATSTAASSGDATEPPSASTYVTTQPTTEEIKTPAVEISTPHNTSPAVESSTQVHTTPIATVSTEELHTAQSTDVSTEEAITPTASTVSSLHDFSCANVTRENGGVTCTDSTNHDSVCVFTCNEGYLIHGNRTVRCMADGHEPPRWNDSMPTCIEPSLDILFVLDGSGSMGADGFNTVKDWVKNVIKHFDISAGTTQVGVVQYSHSYPENPANEQPYIVTEISIGQFNDSDNLSTAIDSITHYGYTTHTGAALSKIVWDFNTTERFGKPGNTQILVLVTDGVSDDPELVDPNASKLRDLGIIIFAVGFGEINMTELRSIATGNASSEERVFTTTEDSELEHIIPDLVRDINYYLFQGTTADEISTATTSLETTKSFSTSESTVTESTAQPDSVPAPEVTQSTATSEVLTTTENEFCQIVYNGICFWAMPLTTGINIDFSAANAICVDEGHTLGNIYDLIHYNMMVELLRSHIPSGETQVFVWTGITVDPSTEVVTFDGEQISYVHWLPNFPRTFSSHTKVGMRISGELDTSGMFNYSPRSYMHGVICQSTG